MKKLICVALITMSLAACVTRGRNFPSDVSWIKKDVTTKEDVRTLLGEPFQVGTASFQPTWTYGLYKFDLIRNSATKELKIYWNPNGTVANFAFTSSFPEDVKSAGSPTKVQVTPAKIQ